MKVVLVFELLLFTLGVAWLRATPDGPAAKAATMGPIGPTTGLPRLTTPQLPPEVVWQPATSTSSNEVLILPEGGAAGKKKQRFSDAQIDEIHARKAVGESKTRACREMFGTTGGNTWYSFQEVWDGDV